MNLVLCLRRLQGNVPFFVTVLRIRTEFVLAKLEPFGAAKVAVVIRKNLEEEGKPGKINRGANWLFRAYTPPFG